MKHDTDYEPNDTLSTAAPLDENPRVSSAISNPNFDSADYFMFPVLGHVTYTLHMSTLACPPGDPGSHYVHVVALAPGAAINDTDIWQDVNFGITADLEFTPDTSGDETLTLSTFSSCMYEFYVVPSSICGLRQGPDYEPNNTASTAAPIELGTTISASVSQPEDVEDYYTFPVSPGESYTLTLSTRDCVGTTPKDHLRFTLREGAMKTPVNGSGDVHSGPEQVAFPFTAGASSRELLLVQSDSSCRYELTIVKG